MYSSPFNVFQTPHHTPSHSFFPLVKVMHRVASSVFASPSSQPGSFKDKINLQTQKKVTGR